MAKAFVRSVKDITPAVPPKHENADSWPLANPGLGCEDLEIFLTEIRPGGAALQDVHPTADHVYFFISGRGYSIVEGERFDFGPGDALFIPRNSKHEMYVVGNETLRMIVTFTPARKELYNK